MKSVDRDTNSETVQHVSDLGGILPEPRDCTPQRNQMLSLYQTLAIVGSQNETDGRGLSAGRDPGDFELSKLIDSEQAALHLKSLDSTEDELRLKQ